MVHITYIGAQSPACTIVEAKMKESVFVIRRDETGEPDKGKTY